MPVVVARQRFPVTRPSAPSTPSPHTTRPASHGFGHRPAPATAACTLRVLLASGLVLLAIGRVCSSAHAADTRDRPDSRHVTPDATPAGPAATDAMNESGGERQVLLFNDLGASLNLSPPLYYGGFAVNRMLLRGFGNESSLRNGFRDFGALGAEGNTPQEGVEVYKGPASALYGNGKPGGDINLLVRRPDGSRHRDAQLSVTKTGKHSTRFDLADGVDSDGDGRTEFAWRLPFGTDVGNGWRRFNHIEAYSTAPSFAWQPTSRTRLMVESDFLNAREQSEPQRVPLSPLLRFPQRLSLGEENDWYRETGRSLRATLEHAFSDRWRLRQAFFTQRTRVSFRGAELDVYGRTGDGLLSEDGRFVRRVATDRRERRATEVSQTELYGLFSGAGITHQVLAGLELGRYRIDSIGSQAPLAALDLLEPVYGARPGSYSPWVDQRYRNNTSVLYLQDRMWISPRWQLLAGLRAEWLDARSGNGLTGEAFGGRYNMLSPRLGIVHTPSPGSSWFASWTQSSLPQLGAVQADGRLMAPEKGRQLEIGWQWHGGRRGAIAGAAAPTVSRGGTGGDDGADDGLIATFSLYQLKRRNLATIDPDSPSFQVASGERESRGVEFELRGSPHPGTDLTLSVEALRARVVSDNSHAAGTRLPGVAPWFLSLWATRQVHERWVTGLGLVGEGRRRGGWPPNDQDLPSYLTTDASLAYHAGNWRAQLILANIFGRRVLVTDGYAGQFIEPRAVTLSISARL